MNNITDFTYLGQMMFNEELKKALEAARQDEARFLSLKEELERKDQHVMHALAESSQLRNQISTLENIKKQQQGSSTVVIFISFSLYKAKKSLKFSVGLM